MVEREPSKPKRVVRTWHGKDPLRQMRCPGCRGTFEGEDAFYTHRCWEKK